MAYMKSCCNCLELREASIAIGIYNMILCLVIIIPIYVTYAAMGASMDAVSSSSFANQWAGSTRTSQSDNMIAGMAVVGTASWILGVLMFFIILHLVFSGLVVYGTMQERHGFLLPWLIYDAISLGIFSLFTLMSLMAFPACLIFIAFTAFSVYCYVAVLSHHNELKERQSASPIPVELGIARDTLKV